MSTMMIIESQKKSAIVGAVLNFVIPGAAYFYCDQALRGLAYLFFGVIILGLVFSFLGPAVLLISAILLIDGMMVVGKYNQKLVNDHLLAQDQEEDENSKTCSQCAESVKLEAKVCKHCGHDIAAEERLEAQELQEEKEEAKAQWEAQQAAKKQAQAKASAAPKVVDSNAFGSL